MSAVWICVLAILAALAVHPVISAQMQQGNSPPATMQAAVTPAPNSSAQAPKPEPQKQQGNDAASSEHKNQVADECAQLLKLATGLKAEVDKTTKDTLSVAVVRKAGELEQLARKVRK
jgi:hypothetical protein